MTDTDQTKAEETKEASKIQAPVQKKETKAKEKPVEKKETKEAKPEKKDVKVSSKLKKVIEEIENLSVIELADLVSALQEKFGVSAMTPGVAMAAPAGGTAPAGGDQSSEQTTFNVILAESGANKISVIKVVKGLVPDLGLKEAKDLVESTPKEILTGVNKEKANEAKQKLEEAGAKVEFK